MNLFTIEILLLKVCLHDTPCHMVVWPGPPDLKVLLNTCWITFTIVFRHGYLDVVHYLLLSGKIRTTFKDPHNRTLLFTAVMSNQPRILKFLLYNVSDESDCPLYLCNIYCCHHAVSFFTLKKSVQMYTDLWLISIWNLYLINVRFILMPWRCNHNFKLLYLIKVRCIIMPRLNLYAIKLCFLVDTMIV